MNSNMLIDMSFSPLWPLCEKWAPIGLSMLPVLMSPRCPTNLSFSLSRVWPTYCRWHLVQVIAYTKLELLHEILVMQWCVLPVELLVMLPVLLSSGQYLQPWVWLQNWKPLSFGWVPCLRLLGGSVLSPRVVLLEVALAMGCVVLGVTKSNMDVCLATRRVPGAVSANVGAIGWGVTWKGSTFSSSAFLLTAALHSMSRRFFGLLYPHTSLCWCRCWVVWFLPKKSQLLWTIC